MGGPIRLVKWAKFLIYFVKIEKANNQCVATISHCSLQTCNSCFGFGFHCFLALNRMLSITDIPQAEYIGSGRGRKNKILCTVVTALVDKSIHEDVFMAYMYLSTSET